MSAELVLLAIATAGAGVAVVIGQHFFSPAQNRNKSHDTD